MVHRPQDLEDCHVWHASLSTMWALTQWPERSGAQTFLCAPFLARQFALYWDLALQTIADGQGRVPLQSAIELEVMRTRQPVA
jgi:hypothetical protein